jgi:Transposase, Mutator family
MRVNRSLAFYDYPAQHWIHLRTTNPIESTFATVRLRTKVTKGHGWKTAGLTFGCDEGRRASRRIGHC